MVRGAKTKSDYGAGAATTVIQCIAAVVIRGKLLVRRYAQAVVVLVVAANLDAERSTKR